MFDFHDAPWGLPHERQDRARKEDQKMARTFLDQLREKEGEYRRVPPFLEAAVELVAQQANRRIDLDETFAWHREKEDGREYLFIKCDG